MTSDKDFNTHHKDMPRIAPLVPIEDFMYSFRMIGSFDLKVGSARVIEYTRYYKDDDGKRVRSKTARFRVFDTQKPVKLEDGRIVDALFARMEDMYFHDGEHFSPGEEWDDEVTIRGVRRKVISFDFADQKSINFPVFGVERMRDAGNLDEFDCHEADFIGLDEILFQSGKVSRYNTKRYTQISKVQTSEIVPEGLSLLKQFITSVCRYAETLDPKSASKPQNGDILLGQYRRHYFDEDDNLLETRLARLYVLHEKRRFHRIDGQIVFCCGVFVVRHSDLKFTDGEVFFPRNDENYWEFKPDPGIWIDEISFNCGGDWMEVIKAEIDADEPEILIALYTEPMYPVYSKDQE